MISPTWITQTFVTIANQCSRGGENYKSQLHSACATKEAAPKAAPWLQTPTLSQPWAAASARSLATGHYCSSSWFGSLAFQLDFDPAPSWPTFLVMGTGSCPLCLLCPLAGVSGTGSGWQNPALTAWGSQSVPYTPAGPCHTLKWDQESLHVCIPVSEKKHV